MRRGKGSIDSCFSAFLFDELMQHAWLEGKKHGTKDALGMSI
jgi:hypothetical protein